MLFLYQTGIRIYYLMILASSLFSRRARSWIQGRRSNRNRLDGYSKNLNARTLWMHVSSLGEFEQGRPILEEWKKQRPDDQIFISFFSPSGFTVRQNYALAERVFYLPLDTRKNMESLVREINPDIFILVKYDFWPNMLRAVHRNRIPAYLISARFRKGQFLFGWAGRFILDEIRKFEHIFVQDPESLQLLAVRGITQVTVAGDTRVDAVFHLTPDPSPALAALTGEGSAPAKRVTSNQQPVIILGSSWPTEEKMFAEVWFSDEMKELRKGWRLIIAPHDISERHLKEIEGRFGGGVVRYSEERGGRGGNVDSGNVDSGMVSGEWEVLLVDTVGHLRELYRYASLAIIGGGFGKGIHNILEPSAYGVPVLFGPKWQGFSEAEDLIGLGSAVSFENQEQLSEWVKKYISDPNLLQLSGSLAFNYMENQKGASGLIIRHLMEK